MRRMLPDHAELDLDDLYADLVLRAPEGERASVSLGMVTSVDGAVAVDGSSAALGEEADRRAFLRLRDACEAIVVGAGTARAEDYGPPRAGAQRAASRRARGLAPAPQLLVVTGSLDLDPRARLFAAERDPGVPRPIVVTHGAAPEEGRRRLAEVAEIVTFGGDHVDLRALLVWCRRRGLDRVLCEGGPRLNGTFAAAGLVDEVFVTVAPALAGGDAGRILAGPPLGPLALELVELHEHEGELLLRYRAGTGRPAGRNA
jgi:riboflavin-specific deaminase-like protein